MKLACSSAAPSLTPHLQDDIYLICSSPTFESSRAHWRMLAKSLWHGITPQNNTEISPIGEVSPFGSKVTCYAVRGPNMCSLFLMLDALASAVVSPSPLISRIAIRAAAAAPVSLRCKVPHTNTTNPKLCTPNAARYPPATSPPPSTPSLPSLVSMMFKLPF